MPKFTVSLDVMAIDHEAAASMMLLLLRAAGRLPVVTVTGEGSAQDIDLELFYREQSAIELEAGV